MGRLHFSVQAMCPVYTMLFLKTRKSFERLYLKYEADESVRKRQMPALELFTLFAQERAGTGRIYLQNVDHCNTHSPFDPRCCSRSPKQPCLEIALPTKPLQDVNDENGEIALCTLSAINLGVLESLDELEELSDLAVRALDSLLDYQDYPLPAAQKSSMNRRTLGIASSTMPIIWRKMGCVIPTGRPMD